MSAISVEKGKYVWHPTGEQFEPERPLASPAMPYRMRGRKIMSMPLTGEAKERYDENYRRIFGHD